jgi:hypothetical protein
MDSVKAGWVRALEVAAILGLILLIALPAWGTEPDKVRGLFFAPQFGRMFYAGDAYIEHSRTQGDEIQIERFDYDLSWMLGGSLWVVVSRRVELLGTFTMALTEGNVTNSFESGGDGELENEFTYSTSLNARVSAIKTGDFRIFTKVGAWLLLHDEAVSASGIGYGVRFGLGGKWEMSPRFRLGLEIDGYLPLSPEEATDRISVALVPEIVLFSF